MFANFMYIAPDFPGGLFGVVLSNSVVLLYDGKLVKRNLHPFRQSEAACR